MLSFSSIILTAGLISGVLAQGNDKIGFSGTLSSLSGGLAGDVTVINATTLMISNYELQDASAPALYWWGTTDSVLKDGFRISNMHITQPTPNPTDITVTLDAGKTTADFTAVGLWCEKFGIDFGQATLQSSGNSSSATTSASPSAASTTSGTAASASPTVGSARGRLIPASMAVGMGAFVGYCLL